MAHAETKAGPEVTPDQWATLALFGIAIFAAGLGYGAVGIVIGIMAGSLRISRAIRVAAETVATPHPETTVSP